MRRLVANVYIEGTLYGPGAPTQEVTPEIEALITNPAAWEGDEEQETPETFLVPPGTPDVWSREFLDHLDRDALKAAAAERGVHVAGNAGKDRIIEALLEAQPIK